MQTKNYPATPCATNAGDGEAQIGFALEVAFVASDYDGRRRRLTQTDDAGAERAPEAHLRARVSAELLSAVDSGALAAELAAAADDGTALATARVAVASSKAAIGLFTRITSSDEIDAEGDDDGAAAGDDGSKSGACGLSAVPTATPVTVFDAECSDAKGMFYEPTSAWCVCDSLSHCDWLCRACSISLALMSRRK